MTNTIFHIGYHKTATTYLQKHIFNNLASTTFIGHDFIQEHLINPPRISTNIDKIKLLSQMIQIDLNALGYNIDTK